MHRAVFVVASAVACAITGAVLPLTAAHADSTVVVRGLGFAPDSSTNLALVGCSGLYDAAPGDVTTYLSPSPDGPAGSRALKYDLDGGSAVGSQHHVASMAATTVAGLSVQAPRGTSGVAYAALQSAQDAGTDLVWVGRAPLTVGAGAWQHVDATGLTYTWTHLDLATGRQAVASGGSTDPADGPAAPADGPAAPAARPGPATVDDFLAARGGDVPGFYAVGLGCDGNPFKIDALQTGTPGDVTTYDLEGYTTTTGITGSATRIAAGDQVTLRGSVASDLVGPLAQGLLVLEAQQPGGGFRPVDGAALQVDGGGVSATVQPTAHTVYRWRFGGSSSADGSVSAPFVVDVASVVTAATASGRDGADGVDDTVAIAGSTLPARPGVRATLWRVGPGGPVAIGSALTAADGSYAIDVPAGRAARAGGWRYYVTVPAGGGNLAGQSPTQTFGPPR